MNRLHPLHWDWEDDCCITTNLEPMPLLKLIPRFRLIPGAWYTGLSLQALMHLRYFSFIRLPRVLALLPIRGMMILIPKPPYPMNLDGSSNLENMCISI